MTPMTSDGSTDMTTPSPGPAEVFTWVMARARRRTSYMTAAEFDYDLTLGQDSQEALREIDNAIYAIANEHAEPGDDFDTRHQRYRALHAQVRGEFEARIAEAKAKKYNGWSNAARARGHRIRYADPA